MFQTNCPADGCYRNPPCDVNEKGRIIAFALTKKSVRSQIDTSTATALQDSLWEQQLAGNAFLILNTSGEKPRPETAELPGSGMRINRPGAKTHTVNINDLQIMGQGNIDFYNKILRTSQNYDFWYFTPDQVWNAAGNQVTVIGDPVIQDDLTQFIMGQVTVKWVSDDNPVPVVFDTDVLLEGLSYEIDGADTIATTISSGDTTAYTATLNQSLPSGSLPDVVWSLGSEEDVVDALGATIDETTGELELNPIETGVYTLTVVVTSETGCVYGTLDVVVTVTA